MILELKAWSSLSACLEMICLFSGVLDFYLHVFLPSGWKVGKRKHCCRAPVRLILEKQLSWLLGQAHASRILWACQASHHSHNSTAISNTRFNVIFFLFLFHSQRTDSKHRHFLPAIFKPFLASLGRMYEQAFLLCLKKKKHTKKQQCRRVQKVSLPF